MTLKTPGVDIIESQDWGPLGGYTREYRGQYSYEPLVTVSPRVPGYWAPWAPTSSSSNCNSG